MIGKAPGGHLTHIAKPDSPTDSLCGRVKGSLRIEPNTKRAGCKVCRRSVALGR